MKIQLKTEPRGEFREVQVVSGTTIEEIYKARQHGGVDQLLEDFLSAARHYRMRQFE